MCTARRFRVQICGKVKSFETTHKYDTFICFSSLCILGQCRLVIQIKKVDNISKQATFFFFFTSQNKAPLSEPCLVGSLGIDQSQSQAASLSTGRSAEDDTFSDSALSMTALEWNPQPCLLTAKVISIILFLTNSSHPSLNLIGLWGSCKTKTANLSVRVWTALAIEYFSSSLRPVFSEVWKTWQSHFRCSDVTQSFWLKSSLNMRFGLLWCGVSSEVILACYLPLLFSVTHSCKDWRGSCQSWDSAFYSWWLQIKDTGKVNSGSAMTSRMLKLLPVFTPARHLKGAVHPKIKNAYFPSYI